MVDRLLGWTRRRPVRTPTILQMEAVECGAAALAMILANHGRWVPLEELRAACGVSRDGSRASHMLRAARGYGLEARGFRHGAEELAELPMPAIVFVNRNHFMVLEGVDRDRFFLNDPAGGHMVLTAEEFDRIYSGVVLTFRPEEAFQPGGARPPVMARLLVWLRESRDAIAHILLSGISLGLLAIVMPSFTRIFIDDYLIDGQSHWVPWLLVVMFVVVMMQAGFAWMSAIVRRRLSVWVATRAESRFVWRMLRLPMRFFAQRYAGGIGNRTSLGQELGLHAASEAPGLVTNAISVLVFFSMMLAYSSALAAVVVLSVLGNLVMFLSMRRHLEALRQKATMDEMKLHARTMQGLQMVESLKATGADNPYFEGWAGQHALVVNAHQGIARTEALFASLPAFIGRIAGALVLTLGGWLVIDGQVTLGTLIAFRVLQGGLNAPLDVLMENGTRLQGARGVLDQFDDVLLHEEAAEFAPSPSAAETMTAGLGAVHRLTGRLALRGVSFGYNRLEPPLIEDLDLDLAPGAWVALVGASGSGKSTVGKLVAGLHQPWAGEVLLDGRPIANLPRHLLRNSLAVVDQEIVLMEGTVRDNITLWDDTMPEAMMIEAARDAAIHDVIVHRSGGYAAHVEEDGRNFSGGQRQRLEIARALVTGPTLLVLDEATSALDPLVEKQVMDNLRRRGCGLLIIAHRLSTVRDCDEIVVMDQGRVLERGTHDALMACGGAYARLIEA